MLFLTVCSRDLMVTCEDSGSLPVKIAWNTNRTFGRLFYIATCFLLLPVFIIIKSFLDLTHLSATGGGGGGKFNYWFFNFFSFPHNRLLAHIMSSIMYLLMFLTETAVENVYLRGVVIVYCLGYIIESLQRFTRKSYFTKCFYRKFDILSFLAQLCMFAGLVMKALDQRREECEVEAAWARHTVIGGCRCPTETLSEADVYPMECELAACLHGLGVTLLTILIIFYLFQVKEDDDDDDNDDVSTCFSFTPALALWRS